MTIKRVMLEMGAGNDLHGADYTKAALRAVQDALHHSSLGFADALGLDMEAMQVDVIIGVAEPEEVDRERIKAALPHGQVTVSAKRGGLDLENPSRDTHTVVASAAIIVSLDLP